MFDLFKKEEIQSLKARISQLEEENRILSLQLDKKEEKAKKTITTKQDVDRELNEARNKISSLTNEIQTLKQETSQEFKFRLSESLSKNRLEEIIFFISAMKSKISTLITVYLEKDKAVGDVARETANLLDSSALHLIEKIESSTGKIILYDTNRIVNLVIIPVFPILTSECVLGTQFDLEPLKQNLEYEKILVVNTHAGETIIGIVETDTFVEHEVIRSSVMGKHKQGGWSQKRFQSLVEEDVKHHANKVRSALDPILSKHKDIQYVLAGGEGKLIKMIMEGYDFPLVMKSMDTISNGNVDQVLRDVLAVRCYWI
ncbi:MAG TPA: Vms1/Ankzf1 family peptidyl-tRNA hydrolase [Candidatus Methanoperedens sp.]